LTTAREKKVFCETKTDDGGRVLKEFDLNDEDCKSEYEMVCKTGDYFSEKKIISEVVVKFKMPNPNKKYSKDEVLRSYKKIMKKIHPDVSPELNRLATIVNEAKDVILNQYT